MKFVAAVTLATLGACTTPPPCPWAWVPGAKVEACSADSLTVTSSATPAEVAAAFRAHGFAIGRDESWMPKDKRLIVVGPDAKTYLVDYAAGAVTLQPSTSARTLIMQPRAAR